MAKIRGQKEHIMKKSTLKKAAARVSAIAAALMLLVNSTVLPVTADEIIQEAAQEQQVLLQEDTVVEEVPDAMEQELTVPVAEEIEAPGEIAVPEQVDIPEETGISVQSDTPEEIENSEEIEAPDAAAALDQTDISEETPVQNDAFQEEELVCESLELEKYVIQLGGFPEEVDPSLLFAAAGADYDGFYAALKSALDSMQVTVDVSQYNIPSSNIRQIVSSYLNEHLEYFYVSGGYSIRSYTSGTVVNVEFGYREYEGYTTEEILARKQIVDNTVTNILAEMDAGWTDLQKALYLHDYVVTHCSYDLTYSNYSLDYVFIEQSAVCQGYATAYAYLMNRVGIPCEVVSSRGNNHAWNRVVLNGKYYYVDCTWDDPTGPLYRLYARHMNFLRSTEGMAATGHEHTDWQVLDENIYDDPTGTEYDSFSWIGSYGNFDRVAIDGQYILFERSDEKMLILLDCVTGETTQYEMAFYMPCQGLAALNGEFYYAQNNKIYRLDLGSGRSALIYQVESEYSVYGMETSGGVIYYDLASGREIDDWVSTNPLNTDESVDYDVIDISIEPQNPEVYIDESVQLTAILTKTGAVPYNDIVWHSSNEYVATVSEDGTVTGIQAGTVQITAVSVTYPEKKAVCTVSVVKKIETIETDPLVEFYVGESMSLSLYYTPWDANGNRVKWRSSDESIVTVEDGRITGTGPGTATVIASCDGVSAESNITVRQPVKDILLDHYSLIMAVGDTVRINRTLVPADADPRYSYWESSDENIAGVTGIGEVTALNPGTAVITYNTQADCIKTASCEITVINKPVKVTGITLNRTKSTIKTGESQTLKATITPSDATDKTVQWGSSDESVAIVDSTGKVTAVSPGTATIIATAADGSGKTASCTVIVPQPVTGLTLDKTEVTIKKGVTNTLKVTVSPANAANKTVTWKSSDESVATVDNAGKVTAVKTGSANITVTAVDGTGIEASCTVTVIQQVTGIKLDKTTAAIKTGGIQTLKATVEPSDASDKTVTWNSSNETVAKVDNTGKVTAVAPGTATITVTATDGSGKTATCTVTVPQPVTGVTLNKTAVTISLGMTTTLKVTVAPSNAADKSVTWKSGDESIATVDSTGKATAVGIGAVTITVTAADGSGKTAACEITVTDQVPTKEMYRLYNPRSGEHFYTSSAYERDQLIKRGPWVYEGIAWNAPVESEYPVYRMYSPKSKAHHYTMDKNERDVLCGMGKYTGRGMGWNYEGVGWYSAIDPAGYEALPEAEKAQYTPLHRLYNPRYPMVSAHHYTADTNEVRVLTTQRGWKYEGIAWYGAN